MQQDVESEGPEDVEPEVEDLHCEDCRVVVGQVVGHRRPATAGTGMLCERCGAVRGVMDAVARSRTAPSMLALLADLEARAESGEATDSDLRYYRLLVHGDRLGVLIEAERRLNQARG